MNSLEQFKGVALKAPNLAERESVSSDYKCSADVSLDVLADTYKQAFLNTYCTNNLSTQEQTNELYNLYPCRFLRACNVKLTQLGFIGFSPNHQSIAIILKDRYGNTQAIATRHLRDKAGQIIKDKKWIRAKGSNNSYIPYKINKNDDVVFIAEGVGEVGIFEILNASYICFQNAGELKKFSFNPLKDEILSQLKDKSVICLVDNDEVGRSGIQEIYPIIGEYCKELLKVEFKDKPKGYDFRDLITEISNQYKVKEILSIIKKELHKRKERV